MKTTGRKFKCIGLNEVKEIAWSGYFKEGDIYDEHVISKKKYRLYLWDKGEEHRQPYYWIVDSSQFELIK